MSFTIEVLRISLLCKILIAPFYFYFFLLFSFLVVAKTEWWINYALKLLLFLTDQEQARCSCLDTYGAEFLKKINKGILYINKLPKEYDLKNLSTSELYQIKIKLAGFMSIVQTVSKCIGERTTNQIDQFTGMFIQEDLKVVLEIDSTLSEQEQLERMNRPSIELLDEFCPQHTEAVLKLQELINAAQILPPGLQ